MIHTSLKEKIGYGFGDMSSSMFWKIFSYYLPFFYSNIFGLRLDQVAVLLLVTRIWDAVSDPMMGILADRTRTKWGKYRPYLLIMAVPFALSGIFLFTTPEASPTIKLVWAYVTYIMMMTVYTGINVPYGAMLGVMTDDSDTKTVLSSYRMFFAYGGSFIALFAWEPLCKMMEGFGDSTTGSWQHSMVVIALLCLLLFLACFGMTKEKLKSVSTASVGSDLKSLLKNAPWWILIGAAICSNLFNTVRGSTVAYFFKDVVGDGTMLHLGGLEILFYAGLFLSIGEICNMIGVVLAVPMTRAIGKKNTYAATLVGLIALSILFFYIPISGSGYWWMLVLQVFISILTGIISPLVWSMYADVSDFAELRDGTASTALIFSSASMSQKFGGAFGGAAVMWLLAAFGYDTTEGAVQTETAVYGLKLLMSWIPAAVAALSLIVIYFYPLTRKRMESIQKELAEVRAENHTIENPSTTSKENDNNEHHTGLPKVMKWVFAALVAIIVAEGAFALTSRTDNIETAAGVRPLHVEGTQLCYPDGSPAVFKGVSFGWSNLWPRFYTAETLKYIHENWGANIFRAAIGVDDLIDDHTGLSDTKKLYEGFRSNPEEGYRCLYAVVDAAIDCGCYIIVDWHSHVMHTEDALAFFKTVSSRYAGVPNVIYELYNEPVEDSWDSLKEYSKTLIAAIRANSPDALILVGNPHWDQDIHLAAAEPITEYDNLMYTMHFYAATHKDDLRNRTEAAIEAGLPVFISECAAMECTGDGPLDYQSWKEWTDMAARHGVSIVVWSLSDKNESCSMMLPEASSNGPWTEDVTREWGKAVKKWLSE